MLKNFISKEKKWHLYAYIAVFLVLVTAHIIVANRATNPQVVFIRYSLIVGSLDADMFVTIVVVKQLAPMLMSVEKVQMERTIGMKKVEKIFQLIHKA